MPNSQTFSIKPIQEILLVPHGGWHNDTIVTVEKKIKKTHIRYIRGDPMKYSLVQVERAYEGLVDGVWLQNHTGTLASATEEARATERANSNRITVAVVEDLGYSEPNYSFRTSLTRLAKGQSFDLYAGYEADGSYLPLSSLSWTEATAPKSTNNSPLPEHCDIYDRFYMLQVVDTIQRPWNLENVTEMWVSTMPGTQELVVSLIAEDKRPTNYPLRGEEAQKIFDLVNSWASFSLKKVHSEKHAVDSQSLSASMHTVHIFHSTEKEQKLFDQTIQYWSNACGDLHHHGKYDITDTGLPEPLQRAYYELWTDGYGSYCYLVETPDGYGVALVNEYDDCFAEDCQLTMEELFDRACWDATIVADDDAFQNAKIYVGEHSGVEACHELIVVFPASTPASEFKYAAKTLDEIVYQSAKHPIKTVRQDTPIQTTPKNEQLTATDTLQPYRIAITETYVKEVEIYAPDELSAHQIANDLCAEGTITLDYDHFVDRSTECRGIARPMDLELHEVYGQNARKEVTNTSLDAKIQFAQAQTAAPLTTLPNTSSKQAFREENPIKKEEYR